MANKLLITDELDHDKVADIHAQGGLDVLPIYTYAYLPSATGSGVISTTPCYLHSVIVGSTGASGQYLVLADMADSDSACPAVGGTSAEKMIIIGGATRGQYIYDILCSSTLCYLISGAHDSAAAAPGNDGITVMYKLVG
uniref:Head decoration protein n=1 Tax=viral metagenome TaxID=1070528 RepID=A0A6H1ZPX7_9ZZZZ